MYIQYSCKLIIATLLTAQEIMQPSLSATSGPMTSPTTKTNIKVTKSTPIRRGGSLRGIYLKNCQNYQLTYLILIYFG